MLHTLLFHFLMLHLLFQFLMLHIFIISFDRNCLYYDFYTPVIVEGTDVDFQPVVYNGWRNPIVLDIVDPWVVSNLFFCVV